MKTKAMKIALFILLGVHVLQLKPPVFAQGTVSFKAFPLFCGPIAYSYDGVNTTYVPTGNPAQVGTYGNLNIAVYYNVTVGVSSPFTSTTASLLPTAWNNEGVLTSSGGPMQIIGPAAGYTSLTDFVLAQVPSSGGTVEAMVLGWTGTYTDWNSAWNAANAPVNPASVLFGWTGSTLSTGSLHWTQGVAPTDPMGTPTPIGYGNDRFDGLVLTVIPEPATFALAGLGAVVLMITRQRK